MAKKNLSSLMTGILGSEPVSHHSEEQTAAPVSQESKPRRGRPTSTPVGANDVRTTFIFDRAMLNQLRYISLVEKKTLKEIVGELIDGYVARWEKSHGEIPGAVKNQ